MDLFPPLPFDPIPYGGNISCIHICNLIQTETSCVAPSETLIPSRPVGIPTGSVRLRVPDAKPSADRVRLVVETYRPQYFFRVANSLRQLDSTIYPTARFQNLAADG